MLLQSSQSTFHVIGCMSGSSLDGLDLAYVRFERKETGWHYACLETDTLIYNSSFAQRFIKAMHGNALELARLDRDLGRFIGQSVSQLSFDGPVDLIASHGHTIFHKPEEGLTVQIGSGAEIAAETGVPACTDFRIMDIALGGQGAPLVPIGEANLFKEHQLFLNLGGIANIGVHESGISGFDTCICNQLLDHLANKKQLDFDRNGELAASGRIIPSLLEELNSLSFHSMPPPKSLGREFFEDHILPLFDNRVESIEDQLCTAVEHIAMQISASVNPTISSSIFVSGGGAFNGFLLSRIEELSAKSIYLPAKEVITHKEAIIFAFLGLLRALHSPNTLGMVTGSPFDSIGGSIHIPPSTIKG